MTTVSEYRPRITRCSSRIFTVALPDLTEAWPSAVTRLPWARRTSTLPCILEDFLNVTVHLIVW